MTNQTSSDCQTSFKQTGISKSRRSKSEKLDLFQNFKCIVERILSHHSYNVWSVHGGLQSLVQSLDEIFQHGVKPQTGLIGVVIDYWLFVRGLKWLNPTQATDIDNLSKLPAASSLKEQRTNSLLGAVEKQSDLTHGQQWIEKSLKNQNISDQMSSLLRNFNHLREHYYDWAFLMDNFFTSALLICLSALEQNSPALLANISASLFLRRSLSHSNILRLHQGSDSAYEVLVPVISDDCFGAATPWNSSQTELLHNPKTDPLSVGAAPRVTATEQKKIEFRQKSASFNFFEPEANFEVDQHFSEISALNSDQEHQVKVNSESTLSSKAHLIPPRQLTLPKEGNKMDVDYKPLFYESSPEEESLLADTDPDTKFSYQDKPANLYFSTVDVKLNPKQVESFVNSDFQDFDSNNAEIASELSSNLPDLVISAQVSQSNKIALTMNKPSVKSSDNKLTKASTHHRRSKSDYTQDLKLTRDFYEDAHHLNFTDSPKKEIIRPTSTFSDVQSRLFYHRSAASQLSPSTSLMNYLKNQDLTTCADIDKENAHFDFSEILIGAIEQMKCQMQVHKIAQHELNDQTQNESSSLPLLPASETYCSPVGSFVLVEPASHGIVASRSGLPVESDMSMSSLSTLSSLSENRRLTAVSDSSSKVDSMRTAESIAIGLLQSFSGQKYVTANDFDWLISEEDVPQKLLPLPKSTVIDPDFTSDLGIRIRGNQDWAPPRPQIIFTTPPKLKLKVAMAKQKNRCAGCGTYVEKEFMKRFRYCEYMGKYFCTCCHDNNLAVLPANVLQKFDFTKYKVSNFSYDLLMKIANDPLFNIEDINSSLYKKAKELAVIRDLRCQMVSLYKYLQLCRFAASSSDEFQDGLKAKVFSSLPSYILTDDPNIYSLTDLERCKSGNLLEDLKSAVNLSSNHVTSCELCRSKGFLCEICRSDDLLFPHQAVTSQCAYCKSCFHKKCFIASSCPKCTRLKKRRLVLNQTCKD